jgi:5-methylcytosine-specific restriction enzyme A
MRASDIHLSTQDGFIGQITLDRYERDSKLRRACIDHYGPECVVCGFSFGKFYGGLGDGFIIVHHVIDAQRNPLDPIKDLRPVCANCHAMLHLSGMHSSDIDELHAKLKIKGNNGP